MSVLRSLWGEIALNNPKWSEEKRQNKVLVRKLDVFLCSYTALSAIVKYLDQNNISNAYVSGMKTDLKLFGNELNFFTTYFNIGYLICIPLTAYFMNGLIRPSLWLPTAELLWGIATGCLAAAHSPQVVYGLRFVIGFFEGTAWSGTMTILLCWYTPTEIGKRLALYQCATTLGGIFSGALQAALYTNLNGAHGLAGWRWLFVVNSCITVAVAGWGYYACPDYPNKVNPWAKWLSSRDIEIGKQRMASLKRELPKGWTWRAVKRAFSNPRTYAIWFAYEVSGQGGTGNSYFNLWLQSLKNANGTNRYTVQQINTIPIACNCITIAGLIFYLTLSDRFGVQWPFLLAIAASNTIWASILAYWNVSDNAKFASYMLLNFSANANLYVAWLGTLVKDSAEERAIIIAAFVTSFYAIGAGAPIKIWPASQAPHYPIGWNYAAVCWGVAILAVFGVLYFDRKQRHQEERLLDVEETVHESSRSSDGEKTPTEEAAASPINSAIAGPEAAVATLVPDLKRYQ